MKKVATILIVFSTFILAFKPGFAYAWDDCIFGKINDEYPGDCARYIDTDNDGICDHSQLAPEDRDSAQSINQGDPQKESSPGEKQISAKKKENYYPALLALILLISYGASLLLTKFGKVSKVTHRKLWNIGLTLSFLVNGLSGVLLLMNISYGTDINLPFNTLFWHVETGIVFTVIAIFHLFWHLPYYKNLLK